MKELFFGAAAAAYANARLKILPREDHGFSGKGKLQAARSVYDFLQEQLS